MRSAGYVSRSRQVNAQLKIEPSNSIALKRPLPSRHSLPRNAEGEVCRFEIHREDQVMVSSTQFCGGDWQWQLCSSRGQVLAEGGGFRSERECRDAIATLKNNAAMASVTLFES